MFAEEDALDQSTTAMRVGESASNTILALSKCIAGQKLAGAGKQAIDKGLKLLGDYVLVFEWIDTPQTTPDSGNKAYLFETVEQQWRRTPNEFRLKIDRVKETLTKVFNEQVPDLKDLETANQFFDEVLEISTHTFGELQPLSEYEDIT